MAGMIIYNLALGSQVQYITIFVCLYVHLDWYEVNIPSATITKS